MGPVIMRLVKKQSPVVARPAFQVRYGIIRQQKGDNVRVIGAGHHHGCLRLMSGKIVVRSGDLTIAGDVGLGQQEQIRVPHLCGNYLGKPGVVKLQWHVGGIDKNQR